VIRLEIMERHLYLIGYQQADAWLIKIGIATEPTQRLKQLQTGNSQKLYLLGTIANTNPRQIEQRLHQKYRHYRKSGEWFLLPESVVQDLLRTLERLTPVSVDAV
jgi:Meiotically up-regulated gene 113